jgi:hypothetical protein
MEDCLILTHLHTGDCLTVYALNLELLKKYKKIHFFAIKRNMKMLTQMYEKYLNKNIEIHLLEDPNYTHCIVDNNNINNIKNIYNIKDVNIIKTGYHTSNWVCPSLFWRDFYKQANIDYNIRYLDEYSQLNRNFEKEKEFYEKIKNIYGENYIFLHDHRHIEYKHHRHTEINIDSELPIFHPNFNYYQNNPNHKYYNLWNKELISDNLLDYGMIMENSKELYLSNSSFSCFVVYLNLSKVLKKSIYQYKINYVDYHKSFNNWILN